MQAPNRQMKGLVSCPQTDASLNECCATGTYLANPSCGPGAPFPTSCLRGTVVVNFPKAGRYILGNTRLAKGLHGFPKGVKSQGTWSGLDSDSKVPLSVSEAVWMTGAELHARRKPVHALGVTQISL